MLEFEIEFLGAVKLVGGGTDDHSKLTNRDLPDQHPMSAITGLEKALSERQPVGDYALKSEIPTKLSQLTGDELHRTLTDEQIREFAEKLTVKPFVVDAAVRQIDAATILSNPTEYEGCWIDFLTNAGAPSKTVAYGVVMGRGGDLYLLTYNLDGTVTQWSRDAYEKHAFETRSLINEPITDMDSLTIDVQGDAPYMASVRDAKNRPENTAVQGLTFVIAYAVDYQMQLYCDIETGKFYRRVVAGTADRHSFSKWDLLNGGGEGKKQVFTATITNEVGRLVCDMTASQIIDADRQGVVKAVYTDEDSKETRTYYFFKEMPDGRAAFSKDGYIENGTPKQTLFYVDYAGNVKIETRDPAPTTVRAVCHNAAASPTSAPNVWYVPKTMPRPSSAVGLMVDVQWLNGNEGGLGYNASLVWGEPDGAENVTIIPASAVHDNLTGEVSIPTEGTVRYQLVEGNGRKSWQYVSGEVIHKSFSSDTAAEVADKAVPGMAMAYVPGMEVYVQLDKGNTAEVMNIVPDEGTTLPVYGNGTGKTTGTIPAGYILHLVNAGDHWQVVNQPGGEGGGVTEEQATALDNLVKVMAFTIENPYKSTQYKDFQKAFGLVKDIPAMGVTLSPKVLNFTTAVSQKLVATIDPENSTDTVEWKSSADGVASVANGLVTPVSNGDAIITATAGAVSATCAVNVAIPDIKRFTVTNNLTNCKSDNPTSEVVEGGSYIANLTADEGFTLTKSDVAIIMGGAVITPTAYSGGRITIESVNGDITITAEAKKESGEVTMLESITFDGKSYVDSGVLPTDVNDRYVIGVKTTKDWVTESKETGNCFSGVAMRTGTSTDASPYLDYVFSITLAKNNYNLDRPASMVDCDVIGTNIRLNNGQDTGNNEASEIYIEPFYASIKSGDSSIWLDEDLTIKPKKGAFGELNNQTVIQRGNDKLPIKPFWIGRVDDTVGIVKYKSYGCTIYCFKKYDENDQLVADLRPAMQGGKIGMYDTVSKTFHPGVKNGGTITYTEVTK